MGTPAQQRHQPRSPSPEPARIWAVAVRAVGVYFAGTAVLNSVYTVRTAPDFLRWLGENTWFPPYRPVLRALEPVAPAVVLTTAGFQATVAYHLLRGRRVAGALRCAQVWVLGLIPALPWPYWTVNAVSAAAFETIRRGATRSRLSSATARTTTGPVTRNVPRARRDRPVLLRGGCPCLFVGDLLQLPTGLRLPGADPSPPGPHPARPAAS
jgi:hypothetical protein